MGIMEAVKKGFAETSKLMNLVLVFFAFNVVISLISLPMTNPANAGNPGIMAVSIISSLLFFLVFIFLQGGAMGTVKDRIKTGSASLAQFTAYGQKFYFRILGLLLIYVLMAVGIILVLALISAGVLLLGDNVATRSLVAVIVTIASAGIVTLLVYPVYSIVVEDIGSVQALRKGILVARNNFGKTFGLFVVLLLISLVISLVIGFFTGLVTIPLGGQAGRVVLAIVNAAVQSYIPIVMMVAFMSFYLFLIEEKGSAQPEPQAGPGDSPNSEE
ncbi:MAG: hypothetical protein KAS86_03715 [Candidatus Omnitrophica bacterium]|nr:hypothetical protein [Candidatus Omnitrophota bacterium]